MGASYFNIGLKGPAQDSVTGYCRALRQEAYVSPTVSGITVLYPAHGYPIDLTATAVDMNATHVPSYAREASRHFECPALCAAVHDDDYLWYEVYESGRRVDAYISDAWYCRPTDKLEEWHTESLAAFGGDAQLLCRVFDRHERTDDVDAVLRYVVPDPITLSDIDDIWLGSERHERLVRALQFPVFASRLGYYELEYGYVWPEIEEVHKRFIRTW